MKCKYLLVIIIIGLICLGGQVFARYILTRNFDVNITTAPLYFEAEIENSEIELVSNQAEISLRIKNNDGANYNRIETTYEISLEENDKFTFYIGNEKVTNNKITQTINGNNIIDKITNITFMPKENITIDFLETVEINITTLVPYKKEINIPITIVQTNYSWNYACIQDYQTYTVPTAGTYKLEVWGAQGGNSLNNYIGGYGGYSTGEIALTQGENLYIVVGGQGGEASVELDSPGGYNGGGKGGVSLEDARNFVTGGGGATHISTREGLLQELSSYIDEILIVAGGGGGGYYHEYGESTSNNGGCAGGFLGANGVQCTYDKSFLPGTGGSQSNGGTGGYRGYDGIFGKGGNGSSDIDFGTQSIEHGASGGGGGFYGGGAAAHSGTGGGSGYIANSKLTNKYMVCYNGTTSSENNTKTISNQNVSQDATSDYSKIGDGFAKITFLGKNK